MNVCNQTKHYAITSDLLNFFKKRKEFDNIIYILDLNYTFIKIYTAVSLLLTVNQFPVSFVIFCFKKYLNDISRVASHT